MSSEHKLAAVFFACMLGMVIAIAASEAAKPVDQEVERMRACNGMCGLDDARYVDGDCVCGGGK